MTKITIDVDMENSEGVRAPYWLILDLKQIFTIDPHELAERITGPFFSHKEACEHLNSRRNAFGKNAIVYRLNVFKGSQYARAIDEARKK